MPPSAHNAAAAAARPSPATRRDLAAERVVSSPATSPVWSGRTHCSVGDMPEMTWLDATAQADLVRRGEVSPKELAEAAIARIEAGGHPDRTGRGRPARRDQQPDAGRAVLRAAAAAAADRGGRRRSGSVADRGARPAGRGRVP